MAHSLLYRAYMGSSLWQLRRWLWWRSSDRRCEDCGCRLELHRYAYGAAYDAQEPDPDPARVMTVHHLNYRRLGRERRSDVALLCWSCHCKRDPFRRPQ